MGLFGPSNNEIAKELYEQGFKTMMSGLALMVGDIGNSRLPEKMWQDSYMIGYFSGTADVLLMYMKHGTPIAPTQQLSEDDLEVIVILFQKYLCPNNYEFALTAAGDYQKGKRDPNFNFDEHKLGYGHAQNAVLMTSGALIPKFQNEPEIIEAKQRASQSGLPVGFVLMEIYLKDRLKILDKL